MNTILKYRPKSLDDFIFANDKLRLKILHYATGGNMTPLVLHGKHGTGKSLLADLIPKAIDGAGVQVTKIAAEDMNTKKEVRSVFVREETFDRFFGYADQSRNYTIVEEVNFEPKAKGALRVAMDQMQGRGLLIFTTNELWNMDSGLKSRAECVEVPPVPPDIFFPTAKFILGQEGIVLDDVTLSNVLATVYDRFEDNRQYYNALDEIIYRTTKAA